MKKSVLFIMFVLCMALMLFPCTASAAEYPMSGTCGENLMWELEHVDDGYSLTISGTGDMENYTGLTRVEAPWNRNPDYRWDLKSVKIENGVTSIGNYAFHYCDSLTSVSMPESVTSIGYSAFDHCENLSSISIPNSVTYIGKDAFLGCSMTSVNIPDGITSLEDAFHGCSSLTSVNIPYSVTNLKGAFERCSSLTSASIPDSVTNLEGAFAGCSSLISVSIPDSVTNLENAFISCSSLTSVNIPYSVTNLKWAFSGCSSLTSMNIPDSVRSIGNYMFSGCSNLKSINIPNSVESIGYQAFSGCNSLTDIYYGGSENDWKSISKDTSVNNDLSSISIHYDSRWNPYLFQAPSTTYNNRLAIIAADMSEKAEGGESAIRALYDAYGISDCECYNFDESAAFAIGHKTMTVNGVETTVLVITARGTETDEEKIGDWLKGLPFDKTREFLGQTVWTHVYEFEEKISEGLNSYVVRHPNLEEADNLKILVTGHSLGGAAANMVAARFTRFAEWGGWWSEAADKEDIYAYTFGAIKVIDENKNISDGYENIHNIYNYYDSFGPNGNMGLFNASAIKAKFGHTELYYLREDEKLTSCNNHLMSNYKKALEQNKVSCSEWAKEKTKKRIEKIEKQLSGIWQSVKRIVSQIAVLCPVDVEIYASDGSLAGKVAGNEIEAMLSNKVYICTEGDRKYIYLLDDDSYTVKLKGTDAGTMTYSVQNIDMDTGEMMEEKTFTDVSLESGKQFTSLVTVEENSTVGIEEDNIKLFVVKEDGEPEKEVLADGNGTEAVIEEEPGKPENPDKPGTGNGTEHPGLPDSDNKNPDTEKPDDKKPGGNGTDGKTPSVKVKSIKISGISKKIAAGKKITLKAVVSPSNATSKSVKWKSSNTKYATVNNKGVVTLKKTGAGKTVTITASAKDRSGKKASYKIKIMKGIVKDVKISGKATRAAKSGTSVKLKASVKASNGANKGLQWKSSNTKYASVNGKGKVTLKKAGKGKTVKITAMATDGSGKKAVVKIKIK